MLFRKTMWPGLADGSITVAFRRWRRPSVRAGGTLVTPAGVLQIDAVDVIAPDEVTDDDARAAGHTDRAAVLASLRGDGTLHRVRFHRAGDDPRRQLREQADVSADELAELERRLARLDWAGPALRAIAARPGVVSTELATSLGMERAPFKQRVRRLKELGLTESLEVGYRLSPRGRTVLAQLTGADGDEGSERPNPARPS